MAFAQPLPASGPQIHRRHGSKQKFITDLSQCLFEFVVQLLPTQEEIAVKEDVRKLLERLIRTIEPDSRLLSFGSTANGFSLRNSDMDLCCLIDSEERLSATDLVTMLGDLLERETKFHVKPLPHARIPIVKLSLDPSPGLPLGIACDIGFENRLALENTRLLMCYAMIDPTRVRTLVLFLKVWSKRRKINSPYKGTLSSYGYVLLVIYYLVHVKNPPVLPNLQQMPPLRPISKEDTQINGYNTWFFDDIELLRQRWRSENTEPVGQLLIDFFRYYSREFLYNTGVASIRAGLLKKESKGWQNDLSAGRYHDARERNRFCIEDPFETDFNVARCVTKDGLYTIRGEFMRASRILVSRPERAVQALAQLCDERKDDELVSAPPHGASRLSNPPPQTPFPVGSQSMRQNRAPPPDHLPQMTAQPMVSINESCIAQVAERPVPEHMAPKRGKWTSPPPLEAPLVDQALFEAQLGDSLKLATASTDAREKESCHSPSSNSEAYTDEDRSDTAESDDINSVQSYTEGTNVAAHGSAPVRRPSWHLQDVATRTAQARDARDVNTHISPDLLPSHPPPRYLTAFGRNRYASQRPHQQDVHPLSPSLSQRSHSRPGAPINLGLQGMIAPWPASMAHSISSFSPASTPLPPSPDKPSLTDPIADSSTATTVYYQTAGSQRAASVLYPGSASSSPHLSPRTQQHHNAFISQLHQHQQAHSLHNMNYIPPDIFPLNMPPAITSTASTSDTLLERVSQHRQMMLESSRPSSRGHDTPTPGLPRLYGHAHSHSVATVTASTPPPGSGSPTTNFPIISAAATRFTVQARSNSPLTKAVEVSNQRSGASPRLPSSPSPLLSPSPQLLSQPISRSSSQRQVIRTPAKQPPPGTLDGKANNLMSPQYSATSTISDGSSPALSSTGTGYESSPSRSPSPRSPRSPPPTAVPLKRNGIGRNLDRAEGEGVMEEGRMFESFAAALDIKDDSPQGHGLHGQRRPSPRFHHHLLNNSNYLNHLSHRHRVTDDPAVLEVSPHVGGHQPLPDGATQ